MVMQAIMSRQSVRKYNGNSVPDEVIKKILEAGRLAPSWVNVQPWKFIVVKNQETKDLLSHAAGEQKQVKEASAVICIVADIESWEKKNFSKVMEKQGKNLLVREYILNSPMLNPSLAGDYEVLVRTIEQLTYPLAYMTLAMAELGVQGCIVGAIANEVTKGDDDVVAKVKETLGLNNKQILMTLLTLGYEEEHKKVNKSRKEFDEVIFSEKLGNKYI